MKSLWQIILRWEYRYLRASSSVVICVAATEADGLRTKVRICFNSPAAASSSVMKRPLLFHRRASNCHSPVRRPVLEVGTLWHFSFSSRLGRFGISSGTIFRLGEQKLATNNQGNQIKNITWCNMYFAIKKAGAFSTIFVLKVTLQSVRLLFTVS